VTPQPANLRRPSRGRIASWSVLALVGCAAALSFTFGDQLSRGLALSALVAGTVLSCLLAWRASRQAERLHQARALGQAMQHAEQLHRERVRQRAVLQVLTSRIRALRERLEQANLRACRLQQELSTVRGNYEALRVELEFQAALTTGATVVELAPRDEPPDPWVTARELWRVAEAPAVKRPA